MWLISAAICDTDPARAEAVRDACTGFAIRNNVELQLLRFSGDKMREKLLSYADSINLAAISLDMPGGAELGLALYQKNPDCDLLYYRRESCDLEPFLCARPISFYGGQLPSEKMEKKLLALCQELWSRSGMLQYRSKNMAGLLPYRCIAYAESDRKYIVIHTVNHAQIRLFMKLDELGDTIKDGPFLRVHQSYLVNLSMVVCLDKVEHILYLQNGDRVPVSKAHYEKVSDVVSNFGTEKAGASHTGK